MMRMDGRLTVILLHVAWMAMAPTASGLGSVCSFDDSQALMLVKESIISKNKVADSDLYFGFNFSSWQQGSDCCAGWEGIECDPSTGVVIGIDIECSEFLSSREGRNALGSKLSPSLCTFRDLQRLVLVSKFEGHIPNCVWALTELQELSLYGMYRTFGNTSLSFEDANSVQISADSLLTLRLINLGLSGELPTWFGGFANLTTLDLSGNKIVSLPESLANLTRLHELSFANNILDQLPHFLSAVPKSLNISSPLVSAQEKSSDVLLHLLPSLESLTLRSNHIKSFSSFALPNLTVLDLSNNNLSRIYLGQLDNLKEVDLSHNLLESTDGLSNYMIMGEFPVLSKLVLSFNNFKGAPKFLINCPSLGYLNLEQNQITSFSLRLPSNVSFLDLSHNNLSSLHLGQLENLRELDIAFNALTDDSTSNHMITSGLPLLSKIDLSSNNLMTVPQFLTNSPLLESIILDLNWISDNNVSEVICSLSKLNYLSLIGNNIGEFILGPSCNLSSLTYLSLATNRIRSFSPGNVSSISSLFLNDNRLGQGSFEVEQLSGLVNLYLLNLGYNGFTGKVPPAFGQLSLLRILTLAGNKFTSRIPKTLGNLTSLTDIDLSLNQLTGHMPEFLTNLTIRMPGGGYNTASGFVEFRIMLHHNNMTGNFPEVFFPTCQEDIKRYNLIIDVSYNPFTASVHSRFLPTVDEDKLNYLFFGYSNNYLEGDVSAIWSRNTTRNQTAEFFATSYEIDLSSNMLNGSLDLLPLCSSPFDAYQNEEGFIALDFSNNMLTGSIPEVPGNCPILLSTLSSLKLAHNQLQGQIPTSLGMWRGLQKLYLGGNQLRGQIPSSLSNCLFMIELDLSENHFSGTLPPELAMLTDIQLFSVAGNHLEGDFPSWIALFTRLFIFDISRNNFTGEISELIDFSQVTHMLQSDWNPYYGRFSGDTLHSNYRSKITFKAKGSPFSVLGMDRTYFGIADNQFLGNIPPQLGILRGLHYLDLSGNHFSGSIPYILGNMTSLQSLDLSNNQLSGPLPDSFSQLTFVSYFNVSHNQLSGRIPSGQISTFDASLYEENDGLCGTPLPECIPPSSAAPTPGYHHNLVGQKSGGLTRRVLKYVSLAAVCSGFGLGFAGVTIVFWLTGKLRFLSLCGKAQKPIYWYDKPYGAYIPRQ